MTSIIYDPNILNVIKNDLDQVHVGDERNKVLLVILLASSKRRNHEQGIIIQKQSSAGGSNLQNSCLEYFDNKMTLTRMTGAYLDRSTTNFAGKILALGEMSGIDSTSSSLRQQMSEGKTELATTDRNDNGKIITSVLRTEGRPCFITTTTSYDIQTDLENRCWKISLDESQEQTKSVNRHQFSKDGFDYKPWIPSKVIKALFNSPILEDIRIINPYFGILGDVFPSDNISARRDSKRFADLITTITWIYQYQRIKIKTKDQSLLLSSYDDIRNALYYGQDALKHTLNKLDKKSELVIDYMKSQTDTELYTRNELCQATGIPYETMKRLLKRLVDKSFVEVVEENRIYKYKLTKKDIINGLLIGTEKEFETYAVEYLKKYSTTFDQVIMPPNYYEMTGPDSTIVKNLLSLPVVTTQNGEQINTKTVPITT